MMPQANVAVRLWRHGLLGLNDGFKRQHYKPTVMTPGVDSHDHLRGRRTVETYSYTPDNLLDTKTDRGNQILNYEYDAFKRLKTKDLF